MSRGLKITFAVAVALIVVAAISCARAQQPPEDGRIAIYKQLLARATDEFVAVGAQLQAAQIENAALKAQFEKLKAESEKKP